MKKKISISIAAAANNWQLFELRLDGRAIAGI
jgi:hypothetical protein